MIYTIAYGENDLATISLDRKGSCYSVSIWNRAEHKMDYFKDFSSTAFTWACQAFFQLCRKHNVEPHKIDRSSCDLPGNID